MLALTHPGVTVEAITTATGNVHVDKVIPNVFTVLDVAKKDVPVFRGADRPLIAPWEPEESVHGEDGMGNWKERPPSHRQVESEHAVQALLRLANESPGEFTLVTLGPLTNIALAARIDPGFPGKIKRFVFMGGTIAAVGNTPMVTAEWNIYCDPEAAYIALHVFPEATMVSWETTLHHPLSWQQYDMLASSQSDAGRFFHGITSENAVLYRETREARGYLVPDPLAMAVTLDPDLIKKSDPHFVTIELQGAHTRGQTVIDYVGRHGKKPNVRIVTELDRDGLFEMFRRTFAG
jgi:purine nucleosidase